MAEIYLVIEMDPFSPDPNDSVLAAYADRKDAEARCVTQYETYFGRGSAGNPAPYRQHGKDIDRYFRVRPIELG